MSLRDFELVAFTAGHPLYGAAVLRKLDPDRRLFSHCLFRDCCYIKDGRYIKNLNILGKGAAVDLCFCLKKSSMVK